MLAVQSTSVDKLRSSAATNMDEGQGRFGVDRGSAGGSEEVHSPGA